MTRLHLQAPAKLNLGLEIVGRRADGFHEIVTILQTVSLVDDLVIAQAEELTVICSDSNLSGRDNLVYEALVRLRQRAGLDRGVAVSIKKRIPAAAGLGGASSDAAAALVGAARLWGTNLSDEDLVEMAAGLGSDVPFFLKGGAALATGRGDRLKALPPLDDQHVLIATPRLSEPIPRKTATLYGALAEGDFSDGAAVRANAERLRRGEPIDPGLLGNAFARPLLALRPELERIPAALRATGAPFAVLSGAGPSFYTLLASRTQAATIAAALDRDFGGSVLVHVGQPISKPPVPTPT
jgi:4-diphosphocytidyl-2-C-methyl-D-erythritol kinase